MKIATSLPRALPFLRAALTSLFSFLVLSLIVGQTPTGRVTGIVTNSSGNTFLDGAPVTIDGSNRMTTTDHCDEFDFGAMGPGEFALQTFYTGMKPATAPVTVTAGHSASVTTALSEDVIQMGTFSPMTNRNADGHDVGTYYAIVTKLP